MTHVEEHKPIYKKIAIDIANKIVKGDIKEKDKISGRSVLASMYNVSPETIRRAVALLHESEVVSVSQGSGIEVLSISAAERFIIKNKDNEYLISVKENIRTLLEQHRKLDEQIQKSFEEITDYVERFQNISPFTLIEIEINNKCKILGKRISETRFFQNTGATIIAYRRNGEIIISPGPDYIFLEGDIIVVTGIKDVYDSVYDYIY
ncbi:MAG: transcriptional regulator, GntR family [Clostridia bacterium]|jgi:K+/H+ antiporter YhaU regulatory subunit KhtT|nr:transcriptional regulator, GntR family [Clostridia bacterium]